MARVKDKHACKLDDERAARMHCRCEEAFWHGEERATSVHDISKSYRGGASFLPLRKLGLVICGLTRLPIGFLLLRSGSQQQRWHHCADVWQRLIQGFCFLIFKCPCAYSLPMLHKQISDSRSFVEPYLWVHSSPAMV